jgi:hypothetical protein
MLAATTIISVVRREQATKRKKQTSTARRMSCTRKFHLNTAPDAGSRWSAVRTTYLPELMTTGAETAHSNERRDFYFGKPASSSGKRYRATTGGCEIVTQEMKRLVEPHDRRFREDNPLLCSKLQVTI